MKQQNHERAMEHGKFQLVSAESLEYELSRMRTAAAGSLSGVFGPRSVTWQIDRESAIFLGAGRALLLQLAHPWVAAAIAQHSDTFANPVRRFHRTFSAMFSMVFGTLDQSISTARRLHRRHTAIKGRLRFPAGPFPAGSPYCANAISALRWVHATLIETALVAYELMLPPLTPQRREQYYRESRLFAALFGIPNEALPDDWIAFSAYTQAMAHSDQLVVTDQTRTMARRLIAGADLWLPVPASYQDITAALLPLPIREAFGFPRSAARQQDVRRLIAHICRFYSLLPTRLRYVGPYQEAEQRLAGKARADVVTRVCNRFWIGRAELPREHVAIMKD
jgi:uncharacterized protein (DUF2236 family)